jgi:ribose-phosphate pyrophosphokinase
MAVQDTTIAVFAPAASGTLGARIAAALRVALSPHEEVAFSGREYKVRALEAVRGRSVYVIQSLFGDAVGSANDRLCQLLFFINALKDGGAANVTACVPYLAYARQDRRAAPGDPLTARYVAQLFEAVTVDRVVTLDVHNLAAFENAFRCPTVHIEAATLFARHFAATAVGDYAVVSPDIGGVKRAHRFRELLETAMGRTVTFALMDKVRIGGIVSGSLFAGDVAGRRVIVVDDLISSGTTVLRAIDTCRRAGAVRIDVAATHASFSPEAQRLFESNGPESVVVTDSVALDPSFARHNGLTVLSAAALFADAIGAPERPTGAVRLSCSSENRDGNSHGSPDP